MNMHAKLSMEIPKEEVAVRRVNYAVQSPELVKKFIELLVATGDSSIEEPICDIVAVRAAQMNGCTFCLDLCVRQARIHGEHELRLHHLAAWRDSTLFGPRERAALAWTEILTKLPEEGVANGIYERVRIELSEKEISDLSFVVTVVNSWIRLNVVSRTVLSYIDTKFGFENADLD